MSDVDGSLMHAWDGVAVVLWCAVGVWHVGSHLPAYETDSLDGQTVHCASCCCAAYDHACMHFRHIFFID